jgi:hypothetical protein
MKAFEGTQARRTTKADDVRSEWMEKRLIAQHHPH